MIWSIHMRRVSVWMVVLALFLLTFSLSACGRNSASQAAPVVQNTEGTQSQQAAPLSTPAPQSSATTPQVPVQSSTDPATTGLQSTDQQVQKTLQSLDGAQNDVNTSSSVQENEPQP